MEKFIQNKLNKVEMTTILGARTVSKGTYEKNGKCYTIKTIDNNDGTIRRIVANETSCN